MTDQQPNEQVATKEVSENHEEQPNPTNESEEQTELKRINEEIRETKEKLMNLKKRRWEIKQKLNPQKRQKERKVRCGRPEKQLSPENGEWVQYPPEFLAYGPWCFCRHFHHKQEHLKHCNPNVQEQFQPYFAREMNLPPEYPMPPMKQQSHKLHKHQCETEDQPKGHKAKGPNQFRKERKGHHHGYGPRYPEWICYQQQYQQDETRSSSSNYSSSSSYSDNEGHQ